MEPPRSLGAGPHEPVEQLLQVAARVVRHLLQLGSHERIGADKVAVGLHPQQAPHLEGGLADGQGLPRQGHHDPVGVQVRPDGLLCLGNLSVGLRQHVEHLPVRTRVQPREVLVLPQRLGEGGHILISPGEEPADAVPVVVLDGTPGGRCGLLAQELQLVEVIFLPALLLLQPAPQVDVGAVPHGHLVAVASVEQQLAIDQVPDYGRSLIVVAVSLEGEPQQTVPGAGALATGAEAEQTCRLESLALRLAGDLGQGALRLEPLTVRAPYRCIRAHHRAEVVVQVGRPNRPCHVDGVEEAEEGALVLSDPGGQARQQVQGGGLEGIGATQQILDVGLGGFAEQSMLPALPGRLEGLRRRQGVLPPL